jgi:hypothetical protein
LRRRRKIDTKPKKSRSSAVDHEEKSVQSSLPTPQKNRRRSSTEKDPMVANITVP